MRYLKHTDQWWVEPAAPKLPRERLPAGAKKKNPSEYTQSRKRSRVGAFERKVKWTPYNRLQPVDAGYLVPLYTLNDIALRYRLSQASKRYFREHILPEPFDIVRRRSVAAHHWPRFTLMALDVVLYDLERKHSMLCIRKSFTDHIRLIERGQETMAAIYERRDYVQVNGFDSKFGVDWL